MLYISLGSRGGYHLRNAWCLSFNSCEYSRSAFDSEQILAERSRNSLSSRFPGRGFRFARAFGIRLKNNTDERVAGNEKLKVPHASSV